MNQKISPFELKTQRYEKWFEDNIYAYRSELKAIKSLISDFKRGVEIGIGSGRFSEPFGIDVGVDPSSNMLKIAKRKGIEVIKGVSEHLPFKENSFDLALVVTTICFFEDAERSLKEINKILEKKGCLIIGFVDKDSHLGRVYQKKKEDNIFYKKAEFYSTDEVKSLLKRIGFNDIKIVQTLFDKLDNLDHIDDVREGFGEGGFIAVKAKI
ncbi:MAG: class I SAM-dependent methyltransferase [Thermoplasmata archaeon]